MYEVSVSETICISHRVTDEGGAVGPLHGHNWRITAWVGAAELDDDGLVARPRRLQAALHGVVDPLDHRTLTDLPEFAPRPPTAAAVARFVGERLSAVLDDDRCRVASIEIADGTGARTRWQRGSRG